MKNIQMQQQELLESVLEILAILQEQRPDLQNNLIAILLNAERLLQKDSLSEADLMWIDKEIIHYLCHPKCLYDFCPLVQLAGETDQMRWQRWGRIVDQMLKRAALLCISR